MSCGIIAGQGYLLIIEDGILLQRCYPPVFAALYNCSNVTLLSNEIHPFAAIVGSIGVNLTSLYNTAAPTYFVLLFCVLLADMESSCFMPLL